MSFGDESADHSVSAAAYGSAGPAWPFVNRTSQASFEANHFEPGAFLDFGRIPQSYWWTRVTGPPDRVRVRLVLSQLERHARQAQRPLSQPEIDAVAAYAAQSHRYVSLAWPLASTISILAAANGRKTFRFPFYQPKAPSFNPGVFPFLSFPILKGPAAGAVWHTLRILAYYPFAMIPVAVFLNSVGSMTFVAHFAQDSRLAELRQDMFRTLRNRQAKAGSGSPDSPSSHDQVSPWNRAQNDSDRKPPFPPFESREDDSRQTTPSSSYDPARARSGNLPDTRSLSWSRDEAGTASKQTAGWKDGGAVSPWGDDEDIFDDDDASPVASAARRPEARGTHASPGGSVWERLRQKAQSKESVSTSRASWGRSGLDQTGDMKNSPPEQEQYSYTKTDEATSYAKSQAQKEFDDMLEAERQGRLGSKSHGPK